MEGYYKKDKRLRRDSSAMLPLYHRTMRFLSDPYRRMKKGAVVAVISALLVLYVVLVGFAPREDVVIHDRPGFQAPTFTTKAPVLPADGNAAVLDRPQPGLRRDGDDEDEDLTIDDKDLAEPPQPIVAATPPRNEETDHNLKDADAMAVDSDATKKPIKPTPPVSQLPYFVRLVLPLLAGFCFGFLGSVPVAGPTSAMVLKLGIQGKYQTALTIALGGAISEGTYAAVAFWGFGSFLAGAKFLLPVSKVLGAVMFTIVGVIFLKSEVKSPLEIDPGNSHKGMRARPPRDEFLRNLLLGLTMSGVNLSLLATYTGAIASVYGTGLLEFTLFLALVFGIGVCCGVSTWFFILVSLLQKYKQRLKKQTIAYIMRGMGCFLLTLGVLCAKSSVEYFFFETTA